MGHFYLNSQRDRDFWLDDGLFCVSLTEVVKHNKKTTPSISWSSYYDNKVAYKFLGYMPIPSSCTHLLSTAKCLLIIITNYQRCPGDWDAHGNWQHWRSPPMDFTETDWLISLPTPAPFQVHTHRTAKIITEMTSSCCLGGESCCATDFASRQ